MLLMGLGAGLLLPTGIDSVLSSIAQDDAGVGSATNSTAMQVGGSIGVAVIGSVLSTKYQHSMRAALVGYQVPAIARHAILGSVGGALTVAQRVGGPIGALLASTARADFMSGDRIALVVGAAVVGAGVLLVLALLPARPQRSGTPPASPGARPNPPSQ
jgi:predicted MFS family arabinose efflux permease